jgi:serine protease Do
MKYLKILLLLICSYGFTTNIPDLRQGFADIVEPLMPAVVNIYTVHLPKKNLDNPFPQQPFPEGSPFEHFNDLLEKFGMGNELDSRNPPKKAVALGSGFIIDPAGYIVTNHHVIKDADEINVKLSDNKELVAKIIGSDARTDLALLKVESKTPLPCVKFGDSDKIRVGDWVIAIGNPFGLGGTVTSGIVSSKSRDIEMGGGGIVDDFIQTDAAINKGNSGGPMFNIAGEVIGVNTAIYSTSGGSVGIGFATPSNTTANIIAQLKESGKITRGMLQIRIQDVSDEIAESLGMNEPMGALVAEVEPGGPGEKAGLKSGDIIIEYNNTKISSSRKLPRLVAETKPNSEISVKVLRNNQELILKTTLVAIDADENGTKTIAENEKSGEIVAGVFFSNLSSSNREKFGIASGIKGVIITHLAKESEWASMGILKGDVISSINQQPVNSVKEFTELYKHAIKTKKKHILLFIHRQNSNIFIAMPVK